MAVFISYSSRDAQIVGELSAALRRAHHDLWIDDQLRGGDAWWRAILAQIRDCDVVLAALSQNMLASKACQAELRYAQALGKPILPVQVGPLTSVRTNPLAGMQMIDFQDRSIDAWMALDEAVRAKRSAPPPLPDPLPSEPQMPFGYLMRLGGQIGEPDLTAQQQLLIVAELKAALEEDGDDDGARQDIRELLAQLRDRGDVTFRTRSEIDALLSGAGASVATPLPAEPASAPPSAAPKSRRPLVFAAVAAAAVIAVVAAVVLLSGGDPAPTAAPGRAGPTQSAAAEPAAEPAGDVVVGEPVVGEPVVGDPAVGDPAVGDAACARVDAPLALIATDANEPVLRIPRPTGWEPNEWMASDGIFRYALYNNALMQDGIAPSALVALDEERGRTDPNSIFLLKRGALSAIGATDVTVESHTVCGLPAETVRYRTAAIAGLAPHPATALFVALQTADRTYTATLTLEAVDSDNPTFRQDSANMLTGFQMLPPAGS
ncbi:MAG TPA: toll/interleukin-1 receptor domain-containing protein [Mycolicibacterium fallax]|nr:toll/interleukin-1 receptor domain-containing protein [Mycolicibacterium fallax]